jgi:hypothetical protein
VQASPRANEGFSFMQPEELQQLIQQINDNIPDHTWDLVRDAAIAQIVDLMDLNTLLKLAELSLSEYYHEHKDEIIQDFISFVGIDTAVHTLDSLQLDKVPAPIES